VKEMIMTKAKYVAILTAALFTWGSAAPVFAAEAGGNGPSNPAETHALPSSTLPPEILLALADDDEEDETFYFGPDEEKIWLQNEIEKHRYQDKSGYASRTVKQIMGWTLITAGATMATWAAFLHSERHQPDDVYTGAKKYDELGYTPLVTEKTVYLPSVIAGVTLVGGGIWFLERK
jgi:hypothetical protein